MRRVTFWVSARPTAEAKPLALRRSAASTSAPLSSSAMVGVLLLRRAAREQVLGPGRRRAVGAADAVWITGRQIAQQLGHLGLAQLLSDGADRGLDDRVAVASAHQV